MKYFFKPSALRQLKRLPRGIQIRILEKLDFYINSENPLDFAEKLADKSLGDFRFRIGEWRVIFDAEKDKIVILKVGHRKDIYRR